MTKMFKPTVFPESMWIQYLNNQTLKFCTISTKTEKVSQILIARSFPPVLKICYREAKKLTISLCAADGLVSSRQPSS